MTGTWRLAYGNLRDRPGRTGLTVLVAALGVAIMIGLQAMVVAFDFQLAPINAGVDAGADWLVHANGDAISPDLIEALRARPEVAWLVPRRELSVILELGGELETARLFAIDPAAETQAGLLRLVEGRLPGPASPGVALRAEIARKLGLQLGQPVVFFLEDGTRLAWPLVGLVGREGVGGAGGFAGLVVHQAHAAALGLPAGPTRLLVGLRPGTSAGWAARVNGLIRAHGAQVEEPPPPYRGRTPAFLLLLFIAGLGPLVGSFLIQNAFSLSLRQRTQELALWQMIGATRQQLRRILLAEGAWIGLSGGLLGLLAGLGLARALLNYVLGFSSIRASQSLLHVPLVVPVWLVLVSLAIGVAVTLLAALRPARAGTRMSALALRRSALAPDAPVPAWTAAAGLLLSTGAVALSSAVREPLLTLLSGATLFAGLMLILPAVIQWVARRWPALPGRSGTVITQAVRAMGNAHRRAAGGARALLVTTGLVVAFSSVTAATWQATTAALAADQADLHVRGSLTEPERQTLAALPGVANATVLYQVRVGVRRGRSTEIIQAWAYDAAADLPLQPAAGAPPEAAAQMRAGGAVLVGASLAARLGLQPGGTVELVNPALRPAGGMGQRPIHRFNLAGVVPADGPQGQAGLWLSLADARQMALKPLPALTLVRLTPSASPDSVAASIRAEFPDIRVETRADRWAAARRAQRENFGTFQALLYLTAGFAAAGIIQTALLTVLEQRRELALLRAAGATPRQIMLLALVQTGLPGALGAGLGTAGGLFFGRHLVRLIAGLAGFTLPEGPSDGWYGPACIALALVLVADWPAVIRAARLPVAAVLREE